MLDPGNTELLLTLCQLYLLARSMPAPPGASRAGHQRGRRGSGMAGQEAEAAEDPMQLDGGFLAAAAARRLQAGGGLAAGAVEAQLPPLSHKLPPGLYHIPLPQSGLAAPVPATVGE